jgi:hypothetical protein
MLWLGGWRNETMKKCYNKIPLSLKGKNIEFMIHWIGFNSLRDVSPLIIRMLIPLILREVDNLFLYTLNVVLVGGPEQWNDEEMWW